MIEHCRAFIGRAERQGSRAFRALLFLMSAGSSWIPSTLAPEVVQTLPGQRGREKACQAFGEFSKKVEELVGKTEFQGQGAWSGHPQKREEHQIIGQQPGGRWVGTGAPASESPVVSAYGGELNEVLLFEAVFSAPRKRRERRRNFLSLGRKAGQTTANDPDPYRRRFFFFFGGGH